MRFRIGVHLGDVIEKADGTIYGDGVNIAARLEGLAEPGGITVSDSVRIAVRGKVVADFEDQGEQQVKNIPHPIRAFAVRVDDSAAKPAPTGVEIDMSLPDKPSIAVLPFINMSGDPEQEYFTDGVTEDIITELSRFHSLFVIARNSTFTYKGKAVDVRTVARELGVRYVLEGSIRRSGNRIRVTAQLIDSLTGNHIWAEKYDRVMEDIFAVQEEVTRSIVAAIAPQIEDAEIAKARRVRPANLSAYEIAVRASANASEAYVRMNSTLRDQLNAFPVALAAHIRQMLCLARIHRQILRARIFAHDHPGINVLLGANEKPPTSLNVIERVRRAHTAFHRDHHPAIAPAEFAFEGRIFAKKMTHYSFTASQIDQIRFKTDQPSRGNDGFNGNARRMMIHVDDLAFARSERLHDVAEIFARYIDIQILDRL